MEAAVWCDENNAYIEEVDPVNGVRRFQIIAIPEPTLEEERSLKLSALQSAFGLVEADAWVQSSIGFKVDANTTANTNIDGLIKSMSATGGTTTLFCDYNNVFHSITLDDLKVLQLEVIQNGQNLYAQKWAMREAINKATSKSELDAIKLDFTMMDFTA